MTQNRWQRLELTVAGIQQRYGGGSIYRVGTRQATVHPALGTGFRELDAALGIGGLPRGRISELIGRGTAGHLRVAVGALEMAQRAGEQAVYIDMGRTVDLDYLAQCKVRFDALTILQPAGVRPALDMLCELAENSGAGAILVDCTNSLLADPRQLYWLIQALRRLNGLAAHASCALMFVGHADSGRPDAWTLPHHVAMRLLFQHQEWRYRGRRIAGFVAQVTVAKNQFGPAGGQVQITVKIAG